jgi:hypothetical protein
MAKARIMRHKYGARTIFIATDSHKVLRQTHAYEKEGFQFITIDDQVIII